MKKIDKPEMDEAFRRGFVYRITVVGTAVRRWHLELHVRQDDGAVARCINVLRREESGEKNVRYWADLRLLIKFLFEEYGVKRGDFQIDDHFEDDCK